LRKGQKYKKLITFKLSERDFVKLDIYCEANHISSRSLLLRQIVSSLVAEPEIKPKEEVSLGA
jgi:hypothetical protein